MHMDLLPSSGRVWKCSGCRCRSLWRKETTRHRSVGGHRCPTWLGKRKSNPNSEAVPAPCSRRMSTAIFFCPFEARVRIFVISFFFFSFFFMQHQQYNCRIFQIPPGPLSYVAINRRCICSTFAHPSKSDLDVLTGHRRSGLKELFWGDARPFCRPARATVPTS